MSSDAGWRIFVGTGLGVLSLSSDFGVDVDPDPEPEPDPEAEGGDVGGSRPGVMDSTSLDSRNDSRSAGEGAD